MNAANIYSVLCECGNSIKVEPPAAGATIRCRCGNSVSVPRLSELRRSGGDLQPNFSAHESIKHLQLSGDLPTVKRCAVSGVATYAEMTFLVEREVECLPPSGDPLWLTALGPVLGILPLLLEVTTAVSRASIVRKRVKQSIACVNLRIAPSCRERVFQLDAAGLHSLLRTEPLYARLLDENPDASVRIFAFEVDDSELASLGR